MMKYLQKIIILLAAVLVVAPTASARTFNNKLVNRPYADLRRWHLGFSIGAFASDLRFTHNGFAFQPVDAEGKPEGEIQYWRAEQADYQPGFCVNGLFDLRLNDFFALRVSPGMYFGSRNISFRDSKSGAVDRQSLKNVFVVLPVDLKFAALRYRNARPYVVAGAMPAFDVSKKTSDFLKLNTTDVYATIGFGCDFYLPFFKLNPEIKFCFGLTNVLNKNRPDLIEDPNRMKITQSLTKATSKMIVLTFYFE